MHEVQRELTPYISGISKQYLREYYKDKERSYKLKLAYINVVDGKIRCDCLDKETLSLERIRCFLTLLGSLLVKKAIPSSFEMIFSLHDSLSINEPIFTVAKKKQFQTILTPEFFILRGFQKNPGLVIDGNRNYPWNKKKSMGVWRGQTTGGLYTYPSCLKLPRVTLVNLSRENPKLIDCAFTGYVQFQDEKSLGLFKKEYPLEPRISVLDQIAYKYLIDIDGNTCNDGRTYWMNHANSVLLKQQSEHVFWFSERFKPFEHYIPFKPDLSDLIETIHWAQDNDLKCQDISLNSSDLAASVYKISEQIKYFSQLITQYVDLLY